MDDSSQCMCVLLPLGGGQQWAVPQSCLAEIVTLQPENNQPPTRLPWRGTEVPVLDFGDDPAEPWLDRRTGAGLIAVILGVRGQACDYWAVVLRGDGLAVRRLGDDDCEDQPAPADDYTLAVFALGDRLYQVPDLPALQQLAAASRPGP